jgi:NitT/TauT family transport system permease protein
LKTVRIPSALSLLIWAALWEVAARVFQNDLLPPLSTVIAAAFDVIRLPTFWKALGETVRAFGIGMALALVVGISVGVLTGLSRSADKLANTWINIFVSAPLTAVVPALMPLLGIGQTTVIATVFLFAVWIIVLDTQAGIRKVSGSLVDMSKVFGATPSQRFFKILLPGALPEILTGIRLGVVRGIKGVVIGQIIVSLLGFGALFEDYLQAFAMARFWALILIVFSLSFLLVEVIAAIERRVDFYASAR